jgi:hypothetical protein
MGHESRIELWSPNWTTFCFVGFGTDRLRCEEAMKTAGRENPNRRTILSSNRAPGAGGQNRSCSIQWAAKQEKFRPMQECFFLTSTFIELTRMNTIESSSLSTMAPLISIEMTRCTASGPLARPSIVRSQKTVRAGLRGSGKTLETVRQRITAGACISWEG